MHHQVELQEVTRLLSTSGKHYYEVHEDDFVPSAKSFSDTDDTDDNNFTDEHASSSSDDDSLDHLQQKLQYDEDITEKIKKCHKYAANLMQRDMYDTAMTLLVKALSFANTSADEPRNYNNNMATCCQKIAQCYEEQEMYHEALQFYHRELDIYSAELSIKRSLFKFRSSQKIVLFRIGNVLFQCEQYKKALIVYQQLLTLYLNLEQHLEQSSSASREQKDMNIVFVRHRMGLMLYVEGMDHELALHHFYTALEMQRSLTSVPSIHDYFSSTRSSSRTNESATKSKSASHQHTLLQNRSKTNSESDCTTTNLLFCMGMIHHELGEHEWAISHFSDAVTIHRRNLHLYLQKNQKPKCSNSTANAPYNDDEYSCHNHTDMLGWTLARLSLSYSECSMEEECNDTLLALRRLASLEACSSSKLKSKSAVNNVVDGGISSRHTSLTVTMNTNSVSNSSSSDMDDDGSASVSSSSTLQKQKTSMHKMNLWEETKIVLKRCRRDPVSSGSSSSSFCADLISLDDSSYDYYFGGGMSVVG